MPNAPVRTSKPPAAPPSIPRFRPCAFFVWLAGQPGYKSCLHYGDADYFNLPDTDVRIAKAVRHKPFPTLEQVHHVLSIMPCATGISATARCVAFALLTGARATGRWHRSLKHVDLQEGRVDQDARDVRTKANKTFSTWFFPVGGRALEIVRDWCTHLRCCCGGDEDPLFPATHIALGESGGFVAAGLRRDGGPTPGRSARFSPMPLRRRASPIQPAFLPRHLVQLGERVCPNIEAFKAWSQNLGHARAMTTLTSYGTLAPHRQAELIRGMMATNDADWTEDREVRALSRHLQPRPIFNLKGRCLIHDLLGKAAMPR
jgi:hypothetical protein